MQGEMKQVVNGKLLVIISEWRHFLQQIYKSKTNCASVFVFKHLRVCYIN